MRLEFRDFYKNYITVHNETASGNVRFEIRTMKDLNQAGMTAKDKMEIVTEAALSPAQVQMLAEIFSQMSGEEE